MKHSYFISVIVFSVFFLCCVTRKKVEYNIPPSFTGQARENLLASLEKGEKLYRANCSECHGIFTKGKDGIPNFTSQQIDNYNTRFMMRDRKNHAVVINMNPEQLNETLSFLRFRKMEGAPADVKHDRKVLPVMQGR